MSLDLMFSPALSLQKAEKIMQLWWSTGSNNSICENHFNIKLADTPGYT